MYGTPSNSPAGRRARNGTRVSPAGAAFPSPGVRPVLDGIRRLVQSLRLSARQAQNRAGISGAQLFVLQKLAEADAQSVNDLAARTATDQSSVSVVVHRLAERGLVERHPDARDRRRVRLTLTPRGRALLRRSPDSAQRRLVRAIESLPPAERRVLGASLARLVSGIGKASPALFFEKEETAAKSRDRRA
ncbi:MAG TPA: MarR family winged helix-turn-helix transcriptional regulator [Thermoanaerobaculia bacterium]|nr:MarR family winged helix-turn-helix transcriptional regulator [Thermoanaerobaculia bacterium]